jgi:D-beta-D-heptose 7-phosphate kinase/D-beta-D-heptose 1-phosphate adenosyltransferase
MLTEERGIEETSYAKASHDLVQRIEGGWDGLHILVIGDVMLDKYVHGTVDRVSPEAPVPVVHGSQRHQHPGGAGNVAMNVVGLGAQASLIGFVGDDEDGVLLPDLLNLTGVNANLITVPGTPTISKLRILGGGQQIVRLDFESKAARPPGVYSSLVAAVRKLLPKVDGLILSDYAKGTLTAEVCQTLIGAARDAGLPVLVDPKGRDFRRYRRATTICPNLKELALATGEADGATEIVPDQIMNLGQALVTELELEYLTVTMSERGITILYPEARFHAPAIARQVFDVSGAGDTAIATLAVTTAAGIRIEDAVRFANVAAGIVVVKLGTVPIASHELVAALTEFSGTESQEKALDLNQLKVRVAEWRAAGHKIVFTNGCFDILHVGRITLLETCRRFGDKIVVGINSDASVSRLKGPTRPVVGERERARLLAALAATDAVIVFDAPTPIDLVVALRPDVLVKGGDYNEESIVGAAEMKGWGGRVEIVPTVAGFSTTNILRASAGDKS